MPYPYDLGTFSRESSTASAQAQAWFDRGLVWSYAFNHDEAIVCFGRALDADPGFALAHWGLAYAAGPNYNKQWDAFDEADLRMSLRRAHGASRRAADLARTAPAVERDLIWALSSRYPGAEPDEDMAGWAEAYAQAMREVAAAHPEDLDVAALFADALLNVTAWSLWDLPTGQPAEGAHTLEARRVLESAPRERPPRPRPRRRPPAAHAHPHRRAARRLRAGDHRQRGRDRG